MTKSRIEAYFFYEYGTRTNENIYFLHPYINKHGINMFIVKIQLFDNYLVITTQTDRALFYYSNMKLSDLKELTIIIKNIKIKYDEFLSSKNKLKQYELLKIHNDMLDYEQGINIFQCTDMK